ncbi:MAG: Membrane protein insertase YidC [Owenweeksia sp. TMED14]|nr:MAG: Membrane protein insertase YidC [Owenweeksia sp. TMED14]
MLEEKTVDRNQIIGFVLIALILIGMSWWASNQEESIEQVKEKSLVESSIVEFSDRALSNTSLFLEEENSSLDTNNYLVSAIETYVLENEKVKYTFTSLGAQISKVELKDYNDYRGEPLYLVNGRHKIEGANKGVFSGLIEKDIDGNQSLSMENNLTQWTFTLGSGYGLQWFLTVPSVESVSLKWKQDGIRHEKSVTNENQNTTTYFFEAEDEKKDYLKNGRDDDDIASDISWVAHKQQYFSSIWTSDKPFSSVQLSTTTPPIDDSSHTRQFRSIMNLEGDEGGVTASGLIYHGPNQYLELKSFDKHFDEIIPFGWGIFGWISKGLVVPMFNAMEGFGWSYGLIIFLMAFIIKLALSPLTFASYKSMAKMRLLKPEMDELGEKYKDDAQKKQQETMLLYQKAGVNPLGGCIPQLLQFPILIAMFRFFPASIELRQESFLWATDLSSYDSIFNFGHWFSIPFYGDHISLFTILMAISTFLYTRFNNSMTPSSNNMMQQQMMIIQYLMPIMLLVWFNNYASGLSYYYFVSNVLIFGQQWSIKKFFINEDKLRAKIDATKTKGGKQSKLSRKMNEMMEAQKDTGNRRARRLDK